MHLYIFFGTASFLIVLFIFFLSILCIFYLIVPYQMCLLQIFSPSLWLVLFSSLAFHRAEVFWVFFGFWGFFFFFCLFRAAPAAYGGSQARGLMRATAAGLHHSHSHSRSELHLQPIPQLRAMPDPKVILIIMVSQKYRQYKPPLCQNVVLTSKLLFLTLIFFFSVQKAISNFLLENS